MRECLNCGNEIKNKRKDAKFCSDYCRKRNYRKRNSIVNQFNTTCVICKQGVLYYPTGNIFLKCNSCGVVWEIKEKNRNPLDFWK